MPLVRLRPDTSRPCYSRHTSRCCYSMAHPVQPSGAGIYRPFAPVLPIAANPPSVSPNLTSAVTGPTIVVRESLFQSWFACCRAGVLLRHGDLACCDPCPAPLPAANLALGPRAMCADSGRGLAEAAVWARPSTSAIRSRTPMYSRTFNSTCSIHSGDSAGSHATHAERARFVTFVR